MNKTIQRLQLIKDRLSNNLGSGVLGVLDSGDGGLNFVELLYKKNICKSIHYYADTKNFPYGTKTKEQLITLVFDGLEALSLSGAERICIACNTASAVLGDYLNHQDNSLFLTPLRAVASYVDKLDEKEMIGVIATDFTIESKAYQRLMEQSCILKPVVVQLAQQPLVYAIQHKQQESIERQIEQLVEVLEAHQVTQVILGCTHYSRVESILKNQFRKNIKVIDPSKLMLEELSKIFQKKSARANLMICWTGLPITQDC